MRNPFREIHRKWSKPKYFYLSQNTSLLKCLFKNYEVADPSDRSSSLPSSSWYSCSKRNSRWMFSSRIDTRWWSMTRGTGDGGRTRDRTGRDGTDIYKGSAICQECSKMEYSWHFRFSVLPVTLACWQPSDSIPPHPIPLPLGTR